MRGMSLIKVDIGRWSERCFWSFYKSAIPLDWIKFSLTTEAGALRCCLKVRPASLHCNYTHNIHSDKLRGKTGG